MTTTSSAIIPVEPVATARYLLKWGVVVADDVVKKCMEKEVIPLDGALVVRIKKPIPCMFFTFGYGGITLDNTGLGVIGPAWHQYSRDEIFAVNRLMCSMDADGALNMRSKWMLIDMKETESEILRKPTNEEVANLKITKKKLKETDKQRYKVIARVQRRRTTSNIDMPDGREDESDKEKEDHRDPLWKAMMEKERKSLEARAKKLGGWPDSNFGDIMRKMERQRIRYRQKIAALAGTDPSPVQRQRRGRKRKVSLATLSEVKPVQREEEDLFGDAVDDKGAGKGSPRSDHKRVGRPKKPPPPPPPRPIQAKPPTAPEPEVPSGSGSEEDSVSTDTDTESECSSHKKRKIMGEEDDESLF